MFETPRANEPLERLIERLREPMEMDPALDARVMARLASRPRPGALGRAWDWLRHPRTLSVSPLTGLLTGAAFAAAALWVGLSSRRPASPGPATANSSVQFVVVVPGARTVALVGDFNDWDRSATPMHPTHGSIWSVTVPLAPGRHRYAFLVNGTRWIADPDAPRAQDDFDTPSSVVTVGG